MAGEDGDAALLIDWENLKFSLQERGIRPNVSALRDAAEKFGRIVVARAYADWQDGYHTRDPANLYAAGIEPVFVPTRSYLEEDGHERRKNSVDVKLTADCIELCHNYSSISSYVLVTGDQDFLHVVNTLRPYGKRVVIIGVSWSTSARLAERVDDVLYYDREVDPQSVEEPPPAPSAEPDPGPGPITWAAAEFARATGLPDDRQEDLETVIGKIVAIVQDYRGRKQPLLLSSLGLELQKRLNNQTFLMVVKGRLKQMMHALDRHGLARVVTQGLVDWVYLPEEPIPEAREDETQEVTSFGDHSFVTLSHEDRREIVEQIREARRQPGISYLTFNKISDSVASTRVGRRLGGDTRMFVNRMVEDNVIVHDEQQNGFDPTTGNAYTFWSYRLNDEHEKVRDCL